MEKARIICKRRKQNKLVMMFRKSKIRLSKRRQLDDMVSNLSHSPLYLSEHEKAQLLGLHVNNYIYEGITPVPVPIAPQELRELDNCVWYQGWNDIWRCHYYHNVETGESQWEKPSNETFVQCVHHQHIESLPHQQERKRRPQGCVKARSSGCTRHPTKQERKERCIENLIKVTGCNREEAKRALKATKKDLDLAASLIINSRKANANNTQDLTKNIHPDQFYCSICLDVMSDAVCCSDGHSYCKTCICNWLRQSKSSQPASPMTNETMTNEIIPNHALRSLISSTLREEKK